MSNANAQELWDAQELQRAYIAYRKSTNGNFRSLPDQWQKIDAWVKVVRKAFEMGIRGGDNILAALKTANEDRLVLPSSIHMLMGTTGFKLVVATKNLLPGEAEDMRELGLDPDNPDHLNQFHIREWLKGALRSLTSVAGTTDVNSNAFVHNLVYDITATHPFLRYLLGFKHPEVERACGDEAREFFKEKRHLAKACVALGFPKEIIAPDFEI